MVIAVFPDQDTAVATCVSCKASADVPCWQQLTGACFVHSAGLIPCRLLINSVVARPSAELMVCICSSPSASAFSMQQPSRGTWQTYVCKTDPSFSFPAADMVNWFDCCQHNLQSKQMSTDVGLGWHHTAPTSSQKTEA